MPLSPALRLSFSLLLALAACKAEPAGTTNEAAADRLSAETAPARSNDVALSIVTRAGTTHRFTVELAVTDAEQQQGLMHRKPLADDRGMIFPFLYPKTASFWMKDTPSPLDLLFIRPDGTIAAILPGTPNDLHPLSAGEGVSAVLEIRQGRAAALGIAPGDRVRWGNCSTPEPEAGAWRADRFCPAAAQ